MPTKLKQLYDLGGTPFVRELFNNDVIMGNPSVLALHLDRWGWSSKQAILDGLEEEKNETEPSKKNGVRVVLIDRNPLAEAMKAVSPKNLPAADFPSNRVKIFFFLPKTKAEEIRRSALYTAKLTDKAIQMCNEARDSLAAKIRDYDNAIGDGADSDAETLNRVIETREALEAEIITQRTRLETSNTESDFNEVIAELGKLIGELRVWRGKFVLDVLLSAGSAFSGVFGVGAAAASANPAGVLLGLWSVMKNTNKVLEACMLHFENLAVSCGNMEAKMEDLQSCIKEGELQWKKVGAHDVASGVGEFLIGYKTVKSSFKSLSAEFDNCVGKSAKVIYYCNQMSISLNDCLKNLESLETIVDNPEEYGINDKINTKLKKLESETKAKVEVLLDKISGRMGMAHYTRDKLSEFQPIIQSYKKGKPAWLMGFEVAMKGLEVGMNWAAPENAIPATLLQDKMDVAGKTLECLAAVKEVGELVNDKFG